MGPWNLVVLGLLAVCLLPVGEALMAGRETHLEWYRLAFVMGVIGMAVVNYLPTRLGLAAILLGWGAAMELAEVKRLQGGLEWAGPWKILGRLVLSLAPWAGSMSMRAPLPAVSTFDQLWLAFRDRFGLIWGQRVREQFNRSAANAKWPVVLYWTGLRLGPGVPPPSEPENAQMVARLRTLLQRFMPAGHQ
jgi:hypothetical protein